MNHGHVIPNLDGSKARCGGPALCEQCALEAQQIKNSQKPAPEQKESVMTGQAYITTQMRIIEIGKIADSLDLVAFLKCLSNAENMLPAADPEIAAKALVNIKAVRLLAEACVTIKTAYTETYKLAMQSQIGIDTQ